MENKCVITKIKNKSSRIRPIIVSFENGTLKRGKEENLRCNVYLRQTGGFVAAVAAKKMVYSGSVKSGDELYNNFIGVRNSDTGEMKLIAIDHATLTPILESSKKLNSTFTRFDLQREFGSKKAKRAVDQMRKMQMDVENVKEDLANTVAEVTINEADLTIPNIENEYLPPINRNATSIEEVYDLDKTVPSEVLDSLDQHVQQIFSEEYPTSEFLPLIGEQMDALKGTDDEKKELKCKVLIYLDCLIRFINEAIKKISLKSYTPCHYCDAVGNHILETFTLTSGNRRTRSTALKDKCFCHILVLSLIINNYRLNLDLYTPILKCNMKKLVELLKAMGCHASNNAAVLKLPLATSNKFARKRKL